MLLVVLFSSLYYLMKAAILWSEQMIFLALPSRYLLISKRIIGQKLLSYNCGSAGWLIKYGIVKDFRPLDSHVLLMTLPQGSEMISLATTLLAILDSSIFKVV